MKNQYVGGNRLKKGEAWAVCRFKGGAYQKRGGGIVFEGGLMPQCTLCVSCMYLSVCDIKLEY